MLFGDDRQVREVALKTSTYHLVGLEIGRCHPRAVRLVIGKAHLCASVHDHLAGANGNHAEQPGEFVTLVEIAVRAQLAAFRARPNVAG